jgi:NAD-dependent SIR2 family protein deacetylase
MLNLIFIYFNIIFLFFFLSRFIKALEKKGRLLRNYTQNIDTLEQVMGIENVIECHGKKIYSY